MKRIKRRTLIGAFLSTIILWGGCQQLPTTSVHLDISQKPFERLSQYQFFVGEMKNLQPNERVLPYDQRLCRCRFVWMLEGYREDRFCISCRGCFDQKFLL
ncbi:MAG: hypothetical protein R2788_12180 [Saprospiraceae bacterium]